MLYTWNLVQFSSVVSNCLRPPGLQHRNLYNIHQLYLNLKNKGKWKTLSLGQNELAFILTLESKLWLYLVTKD